MDTKALFIAAAWNAAAALLGKTDIGPVKADPTGKDATVQAAYRVMEQFAEDCYLEMCADYADTTVYKSPVTGQPVPQLPTVATPPKS